LLLVRILWSIAETVNNCWRTNVESHFQLHGWIRWLPRQLLFVYIWLSTCRRLKRVWLLHNMLLIQCLYRLCKLFYVVILSVPPTSIAKLRINTFDCICIIIYLVFLYIILRWRYILHYLYALCGSIDIAIDDNYFV
jgi:hypothetical protein